MIRCMPVLQVRDVSRSEAFYCDQLGFASHGTWGDGPEFCIVQRGPVTIALDRARDPGPLPINQYWAAYVYVAAVDDLLSEVRAAGVAVERGPEETLYGMREIDVRDPDGHLIAFAQDLNPGTAGPGLAEG